MPDVRSVLTIMIVAAAVMMMAGLALAVDYDVTVKTGCQKYASTDANVFVSIKGDRGQIDKVELDSVADDFQRCSERTYRISSDELGNVKSFKIWHDKSRTNPSWFLEYIKLTRAGDKKTYSYPVNRWLSEYLGDQKTERVIFSTDQICNFYADITMKQQSERQNDPKCWRSEDSEHLYTRDVSYAWCSGILNRNMFDKKIAEEIGRRARYLVSCGKIFPPGLPKVTMGVQAIWSSIDTDEVGPDELYVIASAVAFRNRSQIAKWPFVEVTLYGQWGDMHQQEYGTRKELGNSWKPFWGLDDKGGPDYFQPDNDVLILSLTEKDDGRLAAVRALVKATVVGTALTSVPNKEVLADKLIRDIHGILGVPTGGIEFDDQIGKPKELKISYADIAELTWSDYVSKTLQFAGDGGVFSVFVTIVDVP